MTLNIQWKGQERISFLNLLNSLSHHDQKMSLEKMAVILNERDGNKIFTYEIINIEKIHEITDMLDSHNITYSIVK